MVLESLHPPRFLLQVLGASRELDREDEPSSAQGCRSLCRAGVCSAVNSLMPTTAPTAPLKSEQSSRNRQGYVSFSMFRHRQNQGEP